MARKVNEQQMVYTEMAWQTSLEEKGLGAEHKCDVKYKDLIIKMKKDQNGKDTKEEDSNYGHFIRGMESTAWQIPNVPAQYSSIVSISCKCKYKDGTTEICTGPAILFGPIAYLNNCCEYSLRIGNTEAQYDNKMNQRRYNSFTQRLAFQTTQGANKPAEDDIIYKKGDVMYLQYLSLTAQESLGFECDCGKEKCKSKRQAIAPMANIIPSRRIHSIAQGLCNHRS